MYWIRIFLPYQSVHPLNREHLLKNGRTKITRPDTTCWARCLMSFSTNMKISRLSAKCWLTYKRCLVNRVTQPSIVTKQLFKAKIHDGQSVQDNYLMMIKNLVELEKLEVRLDLDLQNDIILQSLTDA